MWLAFEVLNVFWICFGFWDVALHCLSWCFHILSLRFCVFPEVPSGGSRGVTAKFDGDTDSDSLKAALVQAIHNASAKNQLDVDVNLDIQSIPILEKTKGFPCCPTIFILFYFFRVAFSVL